jgi:hypothetical protein
MRNKRAIPPVLGSPNGMREPRERLVDPDLSLVAARVADLHPAQAPAPRAQRRPDRGLRERGPLDERDRVGRQVVVEQGGVLPGEGREPEQVEMRYGDAPRVATSDRERG